MSRKILSLGIVVAVLVFATGCSTLPCAAVGAVATGEAAPAAEEASPSVARTVILYLPNRLLDVLDVVSVAVDIPFIPKHFFTGLVHVNAHATRGMQVAVGNTNENISIGLGYKRRFMPCIIERWEASLGPATFCKHKISRGNAHTEFTKAGLLLPNDEPFTLGLMDYWAVGADATAIVTGVHAEVHPLEIADLLAGFFCVNLTGDDF